MTEQLADTLPETLPELPEAQLAAPVVPARALAGLRSYTIAGGLRVDVASAATAVQACRRWVEGGRPVHVCTLNPEIAELALADPAYYSAVTAADLTTIDGVGISAAVWRQHGDFPPRLTGVKLLYALARDAAACGREVVIVGASDASRREAEARLRALGIPVRDGISPRVGRDGSADPLPPGLLPRGGVVLVALGPPKQEMWIRRQLHDGAPPAIYLGVGGGVDYVSGAAPVPPKPVRSLGLQWLYRLVTDPRTRFPRQWHTLPRFLWRQVVRAR